MTKYRTTRCIIVLSALALSITAAAHAAQYTVTDLGTLGGTESFGNGLNAGGQVAGAAYTTDDAAYHTFLWTPTTPNSASGSKTDLLTLGGTQSFGNGLNASGQVTGDSDTTGDAAIHAFLWKPTTPGGASGTMHDLLTLGGTESDGGAINAAGQVSGSSLTTGDAAYHAFLWKPSTPNSTSGTMYDLLTLGGTDSFGGTINASGQVAGFSYTTGDAAYHAYLWTPTVPNGTSGTMLDLATLGGLNSYSYNVGAGGQVVGASEVAVEISSNEHAFLYTSGSGMVDLNTLIDPLSGWELLDASDINAAGQITGQGLINDEYHAYLLTPVPMLAGDYDASGTVGPEDYNLWKSNFGSTTTRAADGNGNGIIDAADYTVWRDNLGNSLGAGSGAAGYPLGASAAPLSPAVPEPKSWMSFCLGFVAVAFRRAGSIRSGSRRHPVG